MSVQYVKGVGPIVAEKLKSIGINTIQDLLYYFPSSHLHRGDTVKISQLTDDTPHKIEGRITYMTSSRSRFYRVIKATLEDDSGEIDLIWFNQPFVIKNIKIGDDLIIYGTLKKNVFHVREYEKNNGFAFHISNLVPSYPLNNTIHQRTFRSIIRNVITMHSETLKETLPEFISKKRLLKPLNTAIKSMHFPSSLDDFEAARRRLAYEELLEVQIAIAKAREVLVQKCEPLIITKTLDSKIRSLFPFKFTQSQNATIKDIQNDLMSGVCMNRLVQGDVGCGKTAVALYSAGVVISNKRQACLLAPTEILAQQHFNTVSKTFFNSKIKIALLTSSTTKQTAKQILEQAEKGEIDLLIGTHSLAEERVRFKSLSLVIIDEQQKFGVWQRARLIQKGVRPHVLVMTATPIPRTLSMVLFGELNVSIINESPFKRNVRTLFKDRSKIENVFSFIEEEINNGSQAYFIYPRIEEGNDKEFQYQSAKKMYDVLSERFNHNVGLIHGKLKSNDIDRTIEEFREKKIKILVATTLVEIGIDIPDANIIVIDNCERYGLSQMHQLRGRIGRRRAPSYCILAGNPKSDFAKQRVQTLLETTDGFKIAQKDLELRGAGELLGHRQSGMPQFRVANLIKDMELLEWANQDAKAIINAGSNKIIANALRKYSSRLKLANIG